MKGFAAVAGAVALAGLASAALAEDNDPYQLVVIPGSAIQQEIAIEMNTTTGQTKMTLQMNPLMTVAEPTPVGASVYRLKAWDTYDYGATTREWNLYRLDAKSGRLWHLVWDGKTTPSWGEITAAAK